MARDLIDAALAARKHAYAPYSSFRVGAALCAENGRVHRGCNVENASYPQGLCAEATALAAMVLAGRRSCVEIAILAESDRLTTPGCRQKLREFGSDGMRIHACDETGEVRRTFLLGELFPFAFGPEQLGVRPERQ